MKFRTEFKESCSPLTLSPNCPTILIGSCFANNIAKKMRECDWNVFNDAGTLYNPLSISKVLDTLVFNDNYKEVLNDSLFESENLIHSWLFDTHFSKPSVTEVINSIELSRNELMNCLNKSQALIVTFGTAWCYFLAQDMDYVVANCHKQPQSLFVRRRITISEIVDSWTAICKKIKQRFPNISFIFTVSPVRHLKDGFEGNTRSKAILQLAVEELCNNIDDCYYFPAYEIVCDDLRDYRFYASDLVHPSEMAIDYIWETFRRTYIDDDGEKLLKEGNKRYKAANHRPIANK